MAGALRKTMEYLGLAESDERFDDYDTYADETPDQRFSGATVRQLREDDGTGDQRAATAVATMPSRTPDPPPHLQRGQDHR